MLDYGAPDLFSPFLSPFGPGSSALAQRSEHPMPHRRVLDGKRERNILEFGFHSLALGARTECPPSPEPLYFPFMPRAGLGWDLGPIPAPAHQREQVSTQEVWAGKGSRRKAMAVLS